MGYFIKLKENFLFFGELLRDLNEGPIVSDASSLPTELYSTTPKKF